MINQRPFSSRIMRGIVITLLLLTLPPHTFAQNAPEPERETLLNGLRILYWQQPGNPNVLLKLRIHSGAAFDLTGKAGMIALLGDALFPDPATREYATEQLGGKLEVTTTYDAIEVTISGKASGLERMIDLLRGAVLTTQLDADTIAKLRAARIASITKSLSAADVADDAIAARLFGSFPYAQSVAGTPATVAKVDRADLLLSRQRFLNADNASLAVIGGVEKPRLMRALRQLLGPWGKSGTTVPATFRQPAAPDSRVLVLDRAGKTRAEIRLATRGLSRADADSFAANLLALVIRNRWQSAVPDLTTASVRHESHLLPGMFVLSGSVPTTSAAKAVAAAQEIMEALVRTGPSADELNAARGALVSQISTQLSPPDGLTQAWLDVDTFKLARRPNAIAGFLTNIAPADLQRVAARLFKDAPVATVVVGNSEELKSAFAGKLDTGGEATRSTGVDRPLPLKKP
jgi:zinc protease